MSDNFSVRLDFENTGFIIIKRFIGEDDRTFLNRVNKIMRIFLKGKFQDNSGDKE